MDAGLLDVTFAGDLSAAQFSDARYVRG